MTKRWVMLTGVLAAFSCLWAASRLTASNASGPKAEASQFKACRKAAEMGDVAAQAKLALRYKTGGGAGKDECEAVKWFRKAAGAGLPDAQFNLALCCFGGRGVPQDITEALRWFHCAAQAGHAESKFCLGRLYAEGKQVPKDMVAASKWYQQAIEGGCRLVPFQSLSKRVNNKYFAWCVFVDPAYAKLGDIASIEYALHPTFDNPVRRVSNPTHHFALAAEAWGSFNIRILVNLKNGETRRQEFYLNLFGYETPTQTGSEKGSTQKRPDPYDGLWNSSHSGGRAGGLRSASWTAGRFGL